MQFLDCRICQISSYANKPIISANVACCALAPDVGQTSSNILMQRQFFFSAGRTTHIKLSTLSALLQFHSHFIYISYILFLFSLCSRLNRQPVCQFFKCKFNITYHNTIQLTRLFSFIFQSRIFSLPVSKS